MARIPYVDERDLAGHEATLLEIHKLRPGRQRFSPLYRMLLNSPPVALGWLKFLTAIRMETQVPAMYRELIILRIGQMNQAEYEYQEHVPLSLAAGITQRQIDTLSAWRESDAFDEGQRVVLAYIDAMTADVTVSDAVFDSVRRLFDDRIVTELTAMIAAFNLVSRFLVALQVRHGE
jgi:alkylhydroperoxidase family enzyme